MRACVYTCLLGGYEFLNEQEVARDSGLDFICFTDDPTLTSETWRIVHMEPAFGFDMVRSQRIVKFSPHALLPDHDVSLYIDNSVVLKVPPEEVIARNLGAQDLMAVPLHSFRETIADEFVAVLESGLDDPARILEQLHHYQLTVPETLAQRPLWNAILLRRHHDPKVIAAMELWKAHVLRYSRRDQLSSRLALGAAGLDVRAIEIDNLESWFHRWPVALKRDRFALSFSPVLGHLPPDMQARAWHGQKATLNSRIAALEDRAVKAEQRAVTAEERAAKAEEKVAATSLPAPPRRKSWRHKLSRFAARLRGGVVGGSA